MQRQVTVTEAARLLGVSRRTIERRVKDGTLPSTFSGKLRLVSLPNSHESPTPDVSERLSQTLTELAALRIERDYLRQSVANLTEERDYLRQAHAAALTLQQKVLPERTESRPWWKFWRQQA